MIRKTAICALLCASAAQTAAADETATALGLNTIAAAQTLSASVQGMLRHNCEIALGNDRATEALTDDIESYHAMIALLRDGGEGDWIAPVRSPLAQHALERLEAESETTIAFAQVGLSGSVDPAYLEHLYPARDRSLAAAEDVAAILSETFMLRRLGLLESTTFDALSDIVAATHSIAGDACMVTVGASVDAARADLFVTLDTVVQTVALLRTGDAMAKILPPDASSAAAIACVAGEVDAVAAQLDTWRDGQPDAAAYEGLVNALDGLHANASQAVEVFAAGIMGQGGAEPACIVSTTPES